MVVNKSEKNKRTFALIGNIGFSIITCNCLKNTLLKSYDFHFLSQSNTSLKLAKNLSFINKCLKLGDHKKKYLLFVKIKKIYLPI